jgi:anthranilate synthase component 1
MALLRLVRKETSCPCIGTLHWRRRRRDASTGSGCGAGVKSHCSPHYATRTPWLAVCSELIADLDTPVSTLLKLRRGDYSFLLESVEGGERLGRYSFVGTEPVAVLRVGDGPGCTHSGDPTRVLEAAMAAHSLLPVPSVRLPALSGGGVFYIGYDAVRHWEPRVAPFLNVQADPLDLPEAVIMMVDALVVFDHVRHTLKVCVHARLPAPTATDGSARAGTPEYAEEVAAAYEAACARIEATCAVLAAPLPHNVRTDAGAATSPRNRNGGGDSGGGGTASTGGAASAMPLLAPTSPVPVGRAAAATGAAPAAAATLGGDFDWESASNTGRAGYEAFVRDLKAHIVDGDIIQAVPSHRITRALPEGVAALDIYRQLRVVNPSPYMFYLELGPGFQVSAQAAGDWGSRRAHCG